MSTPLPMPLSESKIRIETWLAIRLVKQFFNVGQCKLHANYVLAYSELCGHLLEMLGKWPVASCYFCLCTVSSNSKLASYVPQLKLSFFVLS